MSCDSPTVSSRSPPRRAGFTLVEVLIALAVVALGAAAVMSALSTATRTTDRLRDRSIAEWVALNRITELRVAREWPLQSGQTGIAEMAGRRWQWRQSIEPTQVAEIWRLQVDVRPLDGATEAATNEAWLVSIHSARGSTTGRNVADDDSWDSARRGTP
jgi:general secretion pathway protein I